MDEQIGSSPAGDDGGTPPALTPFTVGPAGETIVVAPVTAVSRSPRGKTFGVVLSAFALICASVFVVTTLGSSDGASSPEDAVRNLMTALENNDVIGVLESLPPGERAALGDPVKEVLEELQRLEILADFDLGSVPGFEFEVQDMTLASTNLGTDVSAVRFTGGTLTSTLRPKDLPIGATLEELFEDDLADLDESEEESETVDLAEADFDLVTIRERDGWHVSLFYSIAEAARDDETPLPDFGNGLDPIGADTPEGAVRGLFEAAVDLDVSRVIGMLPPDEMRVLYDYGPLFVDDVDEAAQEVRDDGVEFELSNLELRSTGSGDRRRVVLDGFDLSVTDGYDDAKVRLADECVSVEINYQNEWESWSGEDLQDTMQFCSDGEMLVNGKPPELNEYGDPDNPFDFVWPEDLELPELEWDDYVALSVVKRDGLWYVSPMRSWFDPMLGLMREVDAEQLRELMDGFMDGFFFGSSASMQFEQVGGTIGGPSHFEEFDGPDCYEAYEQLEDDATDEEWDAASDEVGACLAEFYAENPGDFDDYEFDDYDVDEYDFDEDLDFSLDDPLMNCFMESFDEDDEALMEDDPFSPAFLAYFASISDCMAAAGEGDHPINSCIDQILDLANAAPAQQEAAEPALEACFDEAMGYGDDFYEEEFEEVGGSVQ